MKKSLSAKELATNLVGDGKRPNKYFVTIAYGWYKPHNKEDDLIRAKNSLDSSTILFNDKDEAIEFFDSIPINKHIRKVTGQTISQIMLEDRLYGVMKEKYLVEHRPGSFFIDSF